MPGKPICMCFIVVVFTLKFLSRVSSIQMYNTPCYLFSNTAPLSTLSLHPPNMLSRIYVRIYDVVFMQFHSPPLPHFLARDLPLLSLNCAIAEERFESTASFLQGIPPIDFSTFGVFPYTFFVNLLFGCRFFVPGIFDFFSRFVPHLARFFSFFSSRCK